MTCKQSYLAEKSRKDKNDKIKELETELLEMAEAVKVCADAAFLYSGSKKEPWNKMKIKAEAIINRLKGG